MKIESHINFKDRIDFIKELKADKGKYKEFLKNFYFLSFYLPILIILTIIVITHYFPNFPIFYRDEMLIIEISSLILSILLFLNSTLYLGLLFSPISKVKMFFSSEYISLFYNNKSKFFINDKINIHYSEIKNIIETKNFLLFIILGEGIAASYNGILIDKKQIDVDSLNKIIKEKIINNDYKLYKKNAFHKVFAVLFSLMILCLNMIFIHRERPNANLNLVVRDYYTLTVDENSNKKELGFESDDILLAINRNGISHLYKEKIEQLLKGKNIILTVAERKTGEVKEIKINTD